MRAASTADGTTSTETPRLMKPKESGGECRLRALLDLGITREGSSLDQVRPREKGPGPAIYL